MRPKAVHDTFVIVKRYDAGPPRVFAAYADVVTRMRWASPGGDAIVYSASDFRVSGCDAYRCGPASDLKYAGTVRYQDIVANERIVFAETVAVDGQTISVALVTWELALDGDGTRLTATTQLISFVGAGMVTASRSGTNAALDNLGAWLATNKE